MVCSVQGAAVKPVTLTVTRRHRDGERKESLMSMLSSFPSASQLVLIWACLCLHDPSQSEDRQAMVGGELGTGNHHPQSCLPFGNPIVLCECVSQWPMQIILQLFQVSPIHK